MAYTKEYDFDDSLETNKQDPADWAIFQHPEGVSDDDDTASQATDHWQPEFDESQNPRNPGAWHHLVLNVQTIEPSKPNPCKGIRPWFISPNDTPEGFVEVEASENIVE